MFGDIYINLPVKSIAQAYTYFIPKEMEWLKAGCRVIVPFGAKLIEGFVVKTYEELPEEMDLSKVKKIHSVLDEEPWFTEEMYATACWMKDYYLCSLGEAMRLFIPGKNSVKISSVYTFKEIQEDVFLSQGEKDILSLFEGAEQLRFLDIQRALPKVANLSKKLAYLVSMGILNVATTINKRQKNLFKKVYRFNDIFWQEQAAKENTTVEAAIANQCKRTPAQLKAVNYFYPRLGKWVDQEELKAQGITLATLKTLVSKDYIQEELQQISRNSYAIKNFHPQINRQLTEEQQQVLSTINNSPEEKVFLLYGITGSGKTQIYIELAKQVPKGKQILILVPEIVLTGQLVQSLQEYFANDLAVIHSRLTITERHDTFNRIRGNEAKIIIGARSALFAPFVSLDTIILDEEHDPSYKQDEAPRYYGKDVALAMGEIYGAKVLLASATPSIESYYKAMEGEYKLLTMTKRVEDRPLPQIRTVDMREELRLGNRKILSHKLQQLIAQTIAAKQQIIIMLNRRGFSTFVMCRSCGYVVKCDECLMPMVYHRNGKLQCHHCDITKQVPTLCPACGSKYIKFFGSGTEKLEQELEQLFPEANILRLDRDTTGSKFAHGEILRRFKTGNYQILLGTQMVAKGHDIPNVTAVGIIAADAAVNLPEFRAGERCFSLITQTAGRAGRGQLPGKVVVQAYSLENYAIKWGVEQNYLGFYKEEIPQRRALFYPPFASLIKLTCSCDKEKEAYDLADGIREEFNKYFKDSKAKVIIMGPAPALMSYLRGKYRVNLLLKAEDIAVLQEFLRKIKLHLNPKVIIDVNPMNTN